MCERPKNFKNCNYLGERWIGQRKGGKEVEHKEGGKEKSKKAKKKFRSSKTTHNSPNLNRRQKIGRI